MYSCEFCWNNARYGHYCTPQVPFIYLAPCYNQDFNFPQDEFIKSSVENLVPNPSESEGENECDKPVCEAFTTFSNILFDSDYEFYSSDDQSFSYKDFSKEIYSNPLFDEEIIPMKIDPHHYNAESDLIESMLNHDSSIISSLKIDSLFDEFDGELTLFESIPPGIDETDCYPQEETHFTKKLLYDNSSPRPSKEFVSANSDIEIESFSPSPIPDEDSDSLMEEIDLSFTLDYPMSSGIEEDDYDSEDGNTEILNVKMMGDISEQKVLMPKLMITLVPNQEKSADLLSHQGLKAFQPSAKCPMMIHGKNTPILDNSFDYPPDSYHPPHPTYETYSGDTCGNDSHFGYNCPPRSPLNYEPEPGYIQNYNSYPHDSSSFPQQYPCCEDCGVTHEPYQCQPKNHDYYHEQNSCYDSNSISFDQSQPQQYTFNHPIFIAHHDLLGSQNKLNITLTKVNKQMTSLTSLCKLACQIVQKNLEEKQLEEEQAAKAQNWKLLYSGITPTEPVNSLSMGDEHLNTIPATKSDEFIKSSVENLVPNPSESEGENECDVPTGFITFSNVLFDVDYDFDSESMPNHDSSIIISSKTDSLFDEFVGELTLLKFIPSGIDETDCHPEKEIRLAKRLLYDNSSPRPPKEIVSDNSNADIESFSPSPIPVKDSDSRMEEIDLPFTPDDPMPPGIEDDDYDYGRDIPILEKLLDNYSLSLPANESYHFDIPSPYRPPTKPPDGKTGTLNIKMLGDVSDQKVPIPNLTITRILNQEKSPDLLSHQGLEAFQPSAECPMIINGKNIPLLDVPLFHFYPP
nr:hypothetical protein [Tanacetum cinerariifolium]